LPLVVVVKKKKNFSHLKQEDGKKWGEFDIGDGIAPGKTAKLVWDESTEDQECKQKIKATYADKSKTDVSEFDFCEEDLSLELK
jgi:hypothetical protein